MKTVCGEVYCCCQHLTLQQETRTWHDCCCSCILWLSSTFRKITMAMKMIWIVESVEGKAEEEKTSVSSVLCSLYSCDCRVLFCRWSLAISGGGLLFLRCFRQMVIPEHVLPQGADQFVWSSPIRAEKSLETTWLLLFDSVTQIISVFRNLSASRVHQTLWFVVMMTTNSRWTGVEGREIGSSGGERGDYISGFKRSTRGRQRRDLISNDSATERVNPSRVTGWGSELLLVIVVVR